MFLISSKLLIKLIDKIKNSSHRLISMIGDSDAKMIKVVYFLSVFQTFLLFILISYAFSIFIDFFF